MLTYKIYYSWLNKNYKKNEIPALKSIYKLVIIFAFLSFLWSSYSINDYVLFIFKLSLYGLLFIITIRIGSTTLLKIPLSSVDDEIPIDKKEISKEIIQKASWLKEQMETNLFYLNPELTLKSLADHLNIHPNILSKIINDGVDKNFSDFVNGYRVNAVIEKLNSGNYGHITLLGLSFECGFNSKTTFNRVFKNSTGMTPLSYKKSIKMSPIL